MVNESEVKQGVESASASLVTPNPRDRMAMIIQEKQVAYELDQQQQRKINKEERLTKQKRKKDEQTENRKRAAENEFARKFCLLDERYFRIKSFDLRTLSDEELLALERFIAWRAAMRAASTRITLTGVPFIGWFFYGINRMSNQMQRYDSDKSLRPGLAWSYQHSRSVLKRARGNDWFPASRIKSGSY